ncbi:MAG: cohesin domain-containing protein [Thermoanaerobaculia bacterium]
MSTWRCLGRCLALAAGLAAVALAACGGGGGGGGPTAPPPPPPTGVSFTVAGPSGTNSIFLAAGASPTTNCLVLEVRASEVTDLYAVSLDLKFPRNIIRFEADGTRKGDFLRQQGIRTELLVANKPKGNLVIGYSRLGEVAGVDGSGLLFQLEFSAQADGSGDFVIEENEAFDSTGEVQADVSWISGSVNVVLP